MENNDYGNNDDFGRFIVDIREECIRNIDSLLTSERGDIFSLNAKKAFSEVTSGSEPLKESFIPVIVDEVLTILLQRFDKEVLINRSMDIVYKSGLQEDLLSNSVYRETDSLGMDYIDEWRAKYSVSKFFTEGD